VDEEYYGEVKSEVHLSLCGHLINDTIKSEEELLQIFEEHLINFEIFSKNPHGIILDQNLIIRIED